MASMGNNYQYQIRFGPSFSGIVKLLVIINSVVFLLQFVFGKMGIPFDYIFSLTSELVIQKFYIHQLITYSFLHGNFMHILFNMLTLWMFGSELEAYWGRKNFLYFFLFCSFFGGLVTLMAHSLGFDQGRVLGASGGIFGVMVAYALIWPNREVLFMLIFPIKIKYIVFLIMIPMTIFYQEGNIAHMAHLGGAIGGFTYFYLNRKFRFEFDGILDLDDYLRRKKFKKYQEEMDSRLSAKDRVDELLEKISKHGYNSLNNKEKQFLNEASTKYYSD